MMRSIGAALALLAGAANAAPGILQNGGQFSTGGITTGRAMPVATGNAALLPLTLKKDQGFRMSAFELPSVGLEFGPVDNFIDDIERLEDELDALEMGQGGDPQAIIDEFNPILAELGDSAYVNVDAYIPVPLTPVAFRAFGGAMTVHLDLAASARASLLDAPLVQENNDVVTDSAMFVRAGQFIRGSVGYGRNLLATQLFGINGSVNVGGRVHITQGELSQAVARINDGAQNDGDGAFDRIEDEFDAITKSTTAVGVDVSAAFVADGLHAGLNLKNLISPSFDAPDVRDGCERLNDAAYCARIDANGLLDGAEQGKYKLDPQATAEVVFTVPGTQLRLASALDLNSVENVGGDDFQNLYFGVIYEGPWYFPNARIGYQSNLSGNKVDALTAGFTLFGIVNIDALYGLDDVEFDGDKVPRAAAIRVGFAVPFR